MAKTCRVTWVLFAAALMSVLVVASVVGVQGKEAPGGAGTITVGNGIYNVSVEDVASSNGVGTYTVSTGSVFPQPNENVLYGGAARAPWSSYLTVRSYTSSKDYVTTNDSDVLSPSVVNLDPALASINATNASATATWNTTNMSDALLITQITAVEGMNLFDSRVRVTTNVTNVGSANVSIGIRYEWDLMIDGNDGSWLAECPDGEWLDTEKEWVAPSFESFETTNDPTDPFFSIFGTVTGNETFSPQPTLPDLLQFAYWGGAYYAAFDYTPTGQIVAGAGNDSAVTYLWGHNGTTAIILEPAETVSVTQYQYVVVNVTRVCEDSVKSFENESGLNICVYTYPSGDQSIVITDGTKTVEIQVLGYSFTCDEVVDLLEGLDLAKANFATLPEVMVIDYSESVDFQLWMSRADYLAERDPTLYVENLQLITGSGNFERSDLNLSCDGESDCYDERVIVGVALLTKMVQGYEGDPLGFDTIWISETESIVVEYFNGSTRHLKAVFSNDLLGELNDEVGAVDFVAGFGDALDWMNGVPPEYQYITCELGEYNYTKGDYDVIIEYYLSEGDPAPSETVRFDRSASYYMGATVSGTGSSLGWGSAPEYNRTVCYERFNETGNKIELIVEYYLPDNDTPGLTLVIDPLTPRYTAAVTAGTGSVFGPGSGWKYELIVSYEVTNESKTSLYVDYYLNMSDYDNGSPPALTLVIDPLTPRNTAAVTAGTGSSGAFGSAPSYEKILSYENVTGNKTTLIVEYYLYEGDPYPSLRLEFDPPSPPNTAAVTAGAGSTWGWGSPPHYDRMESYEVWNEMTGKYDLIVEYYQYENDTAPSLTLVIDPLELLEIADLVAAAGSSETWIPVPPYDGIKSYKSGDCIIVELWKGGIKIAEQSFCGLTGRDLIEQLIAFFTSSLFGVKAPALNLVGLLSLIGLLSMTASRRLKGRRG
jgi:hypothetical protein